MRIQSLNLDFFPPFSEKNWLFQQTQKPYQSVEKPQNGLQVISIIVTLETNQQINLRLIISLPNQIHVQYKSFHAYPQSIDEISDLKIHSQPLNLFFSERKQIDGNSCGVQLVAGMSSYLINLPEITDRRNPIIQKVESLSPQFSAEDQTIKNWRIF